MREHTGPEQPARKIGEECRPEAARSPWPGEQMVRLNICRGPSPLPKNGRQPPSIVPFPLAPDKVAAFGSDVVAETLAALSTFPISRSIPARAIAACMTPSSTILGNEQPQMLLCLHEEARGRDRARLCQGHRQGDGCGGAFQRRPVPRHHGDLQRLVRPHADADPRRHRSGRRDEAPAVDRLDPHRGRPGRASSATYTKWDDQPASRGAARESVLRANWIANTAPRGPTYVNLDAEVQEPKLPEPLPPIDAKRYMPPVQQGPSAEAVKKAAADLLRQTPRSR